MREDFAEASERLQLLAVLQEEYRDFDKFLVDFMAFLGFPTSEIQLDIGQYMDQDDEPAIQVQAQRGQAKTTIAAAKAVHHLIQYPIGRVLIISAGGTQANEISTLIVRVIQNWDVLECLRPNKTSGDRTSVESFDIHHTLKGVDKSPSVACAGITANLQGKRGTLLLADDIESAKNSQTALQRQQLSHLTLDFASMVTDLQVDGVFVPGRIIWLGTPQSSESIYNSLPGRGVKVRIWPGRYPTQEQMANYGDMLAPLLRRRLEADPSLQSGGGLDGAQGKAIETGWLGESKLQRKELDQGKAYFQLQHMLNTRLTDALRFPLKTERLQVLRLDRSRRVPIHITPSFTPMGLRTVNVGHMAYRVSQPVATATEVAVCPSLHMYVDPAPGGVNADETGYAISGFMNSTVFLFDVGGVPGGYEVEKLEALAAIAAAWGVDVLTIEKNMGFGAYREVFSPILRKALPNVGIEDDQVHGQKELRILATVEPILGRGSLVLNEDILVSDPASALRYGPKGLTYSLLHQIAKLSRDRNSLLHDDRLDAVEGTCRHWQTALSLDQDKSLEAAKKAAYERMVREANRKARYGNPLQAVRTVLTRRLGR